MTIHISAQRSVPTRIASGPIHTLRRILGSAISFFALQLSFILLCFVGVDTAKLGGSCASGGPYEIAVECPSSSGAFVGIAVVLVFVAIIGYLFSGGFGVSLFPVGWLVLFGGFGVLFVIGSIVMGFSSGMIVGPVFLLMSIVPIGFMLLASPRALFLGSVRASGEQYWENEKTYQSLLLINPDKAESLVKPRIVDWALSIGVFVGSTVLGILVAFTMTGIV